MYILGIDPGLATLGYGIVKKEFNRPVMVQYGVLSTPAKAALPQRLRSIFLGIDQLMKTYNPDSVAVEELFFSKNVTTGIAVAQARGAAIAAAAQYTEKLYEYTPMQVKQAVCGYGRAEKGQVQRMVQMLLSMDETPKPDDAADALAIAICHAHSSNMARQFKI